jgi:hypothetical protein
VSLFFERWGVLFYGREAELKKLNEMYGSGRFECAVIYGRQRVGKTALIGMVNLNGFSRDVYSVTAEELAGNAFFFGLGTRVRLHLPYFGKTKDNTRDRRIHLSRGWLQARLFHSSGENGGISRERILIENINAKIKVFKITANKYRNRRKRFKRR